ncbi:T9SS type A sorting domain-containing protein [Prevotella corporis]|uniref:T9SS type A sorting domain-containing protein n=1 Tax=Prevotella corporis TaxID=28128 RepID=UPI0023F8BC37|nr:T9SS type A sorting domain-containing protein [Prevotella corporis]
MTKKIFTLLIALITLSFVLPTTVRANIAIELIDQSFQGISISVYGSVLRVEGANDETMYIYNVTGVRVMSVKVDGADKRYNLNLPKGCYIVKVGKVTRKIVIR